MDEEQEFISKGKWWLPDYADQKIVGELTIHSENRIIIKIEEPLIKKPLYRLGDFDKCDIILGQTYYNDELVTLVNCYVYMDVITAEIAFTGVHFKNKDEISFSNIDVHYSNLEQWAFIFGFNHTPESSFFYGKSLVNQGELIVIYRNPDSIILTKNDDFSMLLEFGVHAPVSWGKIEVIQYDYISIKSSKLQPYLKYENLIRQLQNFFTLAVNQPIYITKIEGYINKKYAEEANLIISENLKRYDEIPIKVHSQLIKNSEKDIFSPQMLFTFYDIRERYSTVINNWFEKANNFESIYELYFGTIFNPYMYSQQRFINIVQALESYHRIVMNQPRVTLLTRLIGLYQKYEQYLNEDINEKFLTAVKDTRNYLIHREKKPDNLLEGENLDDATIKLKLLLELCLLEEIGFTIHEIIQLFRKHSGDYKNFFNGSCCVEYG